MELLEVFYRRKLRRKQKKAELGRSDGALCRSPSEASVNSLISRVLRFTSRRSEPASRPHSWHSTKISERQQTSEKHEMESVCGVWHHSYQASASTSDLSDGFEAGISYLRKSPDQYSSRGSMESLEAPHSSQLHSAAQQQRQQQQQQQQHAQGGAQHAYSSCHQLSSARSSSSIDHLNNKRDSAYSSFSTSSSIPEYLASIPSFSPERSYSLETVPQRGGERVEMEQADVRYVRRGHDARRGSSQEHQLSSASATLLCNSDGGGGVRANTDLQTGGVCYRGDSSSSSSSSGSVPASNRHSVGPIWGPAASYSSYESLRGAGVGAGAPAPPRRSDSYAAIRNHERPNSWSSLERPPSLRSLPKGSWPHSSGSVASGAVKGSYSTEGQLHTVMEKSPESSPTIKPRQAPSPPEPTCRPAGPNPQSARLMLPTGTYPAPQPEPRHAQTPLTPLSPGVEPALAQEDSRHHGLLGIAGRDDSAAERLKDGRMSITENGCQSSSQHPQSSYSSSASTQLRAPAHRMDRPQREEPHCGQYQPVHKADGGQSEERTGLQRSQNHQGHHGQSSQDFYSHTGAQVLQEQHHHLQSSPGLRPLSSREWGDSRTHVQSCGDTSRLMEQIIIHTDQVPLSRFAQLQPGQIPAHSQAPPSSACETSPHPLSDSDSLQVKPGDPREQHKEKDPRATHLEMALADVQRCSSPDAGVVSASGHSNSGLGDGSQGPARSLSVLEKVSRFERRERGRNHRSHSTSHVPNRATRMTDRVCSTSCGANDLRNMLERSTSGTRAQRSMSYRGSSSGPPVYRSPADPSSALQRSLSTFQLDGSKESDISKDRLKTFGSIQDISSSSRYYRDSIKAQCQVLLSTSFTRRDPSSSLSSAPPAASLPCSYQPSLGSTKHQPQEKKGPKTLPKPQGVSITPQPAVPLASPHTPKERHVVAPDIRGQSPPALPGVPPVGPPVSRICGRRRLTAEQKKRSYSEPENMNEVGVSESGAGGVFRRGGEASVADRRKMFELTAHQSIRPRQLQHDALAEFVERRRSSSSRRSGARPQSAYLPPQTGTCPDTLSLSSASSLLSLQDFSADQIFSPGERRLPSGPDLRIHQSNLYYPGRVTTPRPPAHPPPSAPPPQAHSLQNLTPQVDLSKQSQCFSKEPVLLQQQQVAEPQSRVGLCKQLSGGLQRAAAAPKPSKSASAEDLLERTAHQHHRSHSSSTVETLNQDLPVSDVKMFLVSQHGRCSLADDRPTVQVVVSPQPPHNRLNARTSPDSGSSHTPSPHRQRQRNGERQRSLHTSSLAASVGLPCPFSPAGPQHGGGPEWVAGDGLDAIAFPVAPCDGQFRTGQTATDRQTRLGLSDGSILGDAVSDTFTRSLDTPHSQLTEAPSSSTSSPPPSSYLSSLRISESSLFSSFDQQKVMGSSASLSHDDFDDVFLQNPTPPSPPPPVTATSPTEDPPLPPPPAPDLEQGSADPTVESCSSQFMAPVTTSSLSSRPISPSSSGLPQPVPSTLPSPQPQPSTISASTTAENSLCLEYQPLPRREKTLEELRVEVLARQLILREPSLAPLLDTWGSRSTAELMEEIFPNRRWEGKLKLQHRGRGTLPDRLAMDGGKGTSLDGDKDDLNSTKAELCEALRSNVTALQQEKEALQEEQRHHQELGATIETLVQERLKTNERDKYSVFVGDLEKVVNLLLSLCSRLSRIDRSLLALEREELAQEDTSEERDSLHHKRSLLLRQTEDAWELKENLDRRQRVVQAILSGYLTPSELQDYRRFVGAKPSLLIRRRHLDDLIRQGEEQLVQVAESLPAEPPGLRASLFLSSSLAPCSSSFPPLLAPSVIPGPVRSTTVTSL